MLRAELESNWKTHPTINRLDGKLPRISSIIRERRTRFAGHCFRRKEELVSDVLLWDPKHGTSKVGRPVKTHPKLLTEHTGVQFADLPNAMENRELWRGNNKFGPGQLARYDDNGDDTYTRSHCSSRIQKGKYLMEAHATNRKQHQNPRRYRRDSLHLTTESFHISHMSQVSSLTL